MKPYPIFLASSNELNSEREKLEIFISRQNKRLLKKNVQLSLEIWEDMGAELNNGRKQDDYNKILNEAEIVVVLFWTKMGKYTLEEFELAYQRFKETGRPIVYVFEKTLESSDIPQDGEINSKKEFLDRLLTEGKEQFHSTFQHHGELLYHFQQTLFDLFDKGTFQVGEPIKILSRNAPHSPSFVIGREEELGEISNKLSRKGSIVLISAEGGMGKTTLAAKCWHENKYTYGHGVYLFCERGILNAMMDDGLGLELQGMDEDQKIRQIQRMLNSFGDDVLLLLDNANDTEDIQKFLRVFSGFNGNILITSRCREVLVHKDDELLLGHLDPKDAKALFESNYKETGQDYELLLERLLKATNYHTLLVEVFSKNLKEASELGENLESFLGKLEEKGLVLEKNDNFEVRTNYTDFVQKHVATTNDILEILYDFSGLLEEERKLLVQISLLPTESYELSFLLEIFEPDDKRAFRDTLKTLFRKGWIGGYDQLYRMSPVIQQLVVHRNQLTLWEDGKEYLQKLTAYIRSDDINYIEHTKFKWARFGISLAKIFQEITQPELAFFLNELGMLLRGLGGKVNLIKAKNYLEKSLASDISIFGEDSLRVAVSLSNKSLILRDLGGTEHLIEAKSHLYKAITIDIAIQGENAYAVAIRRSNLGMVLSDLGGLNNLQEAKDQLEKAMITANSKFGQGAPFVATIRSNLAMVLKDLNGKENLLKAKSLMEMSLEADIANFGQGAPLVAIRRSNLALVLKDLGGTKELSEAKSILERALSSDISNFGEDAYSVARNYSNLAGVLIDLGGEKNLLAARVYMEKALSSDIANFGEDAPVVAKRRSNLATVLQTLGGEKNLLAAKVYMEKALSSDIANFSENAPVVAKRRSNLATIFKGLGGKENLLKAKSYLEQALVSELANFGENSSVVAGCRSNLAMVLKDLGGESNLLQAKGHLEKALSSGIRNFGEDHPNTFLRKYNLGTVLVDLGQVDDLRYAIKLFEQALEGYRKSFGEEYYLVSRILGWIEKANKKLQDIGGK